MTQAVPELEAKGPRATELGGEALETLVSFIANAFEQRHELKRFVAQLHNGAELITALPGDIASAASTTYALVAAVTSRGLLDEDFFAHLLRARPRLSTQINAIRQRCLTVDEPAGAIASGVVLRSGRYKLLELIDHGAVASVWSAKDRQDDTKVAIKVLRRDMRDYRLRRWQFIKGATHLASISHPRVARVIEPHFKEMGLDFCVLQYIHGRSLAEEVKMRRIQTLQAVVGIILDIGTGLAAFHPRIFHGDISPKNIIISENGHATLVDFDLASDVDELPMTRATGMPGTDPYASPEWRTRGDTIDARTDIFSLGMTTVYALYGGTNLPSGLNDSRVVAGLGPFLDENLKCDATIKSVLARACAFELSERYPTIQQFCHELRLATRPLLRSRPADAMRGDGAQPAERPLRHGAEATGAQKDTAFNAASLRPPLAAERAPAKAAASPNLVPPSAVLVQGKPGENNATLLTSRQVEAMDPADPPSAAAAAQIRPIPSKASTTSVPGARTSLAFVVQHGVIAPAATGPTTSGAPVVRAPAPVQRTAIIGILGVIGIAAVAWKVLPASTTRSDDVTRPLAPNNAEPSRTPPEIVPTIPWKELSQQDKERMSACVHTLGLAASVEMQRTLERMSDDPQYTAAAASRARLTLAELLIMRALAWEIADATIAPDIHGSKVFQRAADILEAGVLLADVVDDDGNLDQLRRVRRLLALALGDPPDDESDDQVAVWSRGAPLWRGGVSVSPGSLADSLQKITDLSTLGRSVRALALWRAGHADAAKALLREILAEVADQPAAVALLAALERKPVKAATERPGPGPIIPLRVEPDADKPAPTVEARQQDFAARQRVLVAELKKLAKRESEDVTDVCKTANDFEVATLSVSLVVDRKGRVKVSSARSAKLNQRHIDCTREQIEASVVIASGVEFTYSAELTID